MNNYTTTALLNPATQDARQKSVVISTIAERALPFFKEHYLQELGRPLADAPHKPHPELWPDTGLHAAWLGHSTVLLKIDGITILTDPVFSRRIGINIGAVTIGMKRLVACALNSREVPRVDLVLLSHAHMDHLDRPSLRLLESQRTRVVTAVRTSDLLRAGKFGRVTELAWNETVQIDDIGIRAFQVRHWGARMQTDTYRGYNGYLIDTPKRRVLFGGDTALTDTFRSLRSSRPVDLAIMPIGAYNPWIHAHCTPEQALKMANDAGSEFILPVHHQTFRLSQEPRQEPIGRLSKALGNAQDRLVLSEIGQEIHL